MSEGNRQPTKTWPFWPPSTCSCVASTTTRPSGSNSSSTLGLRNDAAVVEIVDNGPGMTAEQRSKVFRPFFTTKSTGTGLGMPIVKKIMDLHGGEIEIDSTPGRGTAVRLIIPRLASPAPAAAGTGGGS